MASLNSNDVRKVYLITYSNADTTRFNRCSFANAVILAFRTVTTAVIINWACCMEDHADAGVHFHMCVLLDKLQRWYKVKKYLEKHEEIVVNFSGHPGYHTAYQYVIKEDSQVVKSENHPEFLAPPRTLSATRKRSRTAGSKARVKENSRLSNLEVSSMIISNGIDCKLQLLALAKKENRW